MPDRYGPYRSSRFLLEIDSIVQAGFSECTIPDTTTEPIEYREGNEAPTVRKLWNLNQYGNVTLRWGTTESTELYEWRLLVQQGKMEEARRSIAVIILDEEKEQGARWQFEKAWPSKYDAPDLNATGSEVAIEELEITHERMERVA